MHANCIKERIHRAFGVFAQSLSHGDLIWYRSRLIGLDECSLAKILPQVLLDCLDSLDLGREDCYDIDAVLRFLCPFPLSIADEWAELYGTELGDQALREEVYLSNVKEELFADFPRSQCEVILDWIKCISVYAEQLLLDASDVASAMDYWSSRLGHPKSP